MTNNKYREIKITYVHILTLIIAFIAIGLLLFFLGYRIGKGSVEKNLQIDNKQNIDKRIVKVSDNKSKPEETLKTNTVNKIKKKQTNSTSEIDKELQMHSSVEMTETKSIKKQQPVVKDKAKTIKPKKITRTTYYAIQIGAFRDHKGAKKEAQRFSRKYSVEIVKSGNLYKVRIGSFKTEKRAQQEIKNNSKLKGCYTVKIKR